MKLQNIVDAREDFSVLKKHLSKPNKNYFNNNIDTLVTTGICFSLGFATKYVPHAGIGGAIITTGIKHLQETKSISKTKEYISKKDQKIYQITNTVAELGQIGIMHTSAFYLGLVCSYIFE